MVFTPYPKADDRVENPTLRASRDGSIWLKAASVPDPIVPSPKGANAHNADPDLVYCEGRLYVLYMTTDKAGDAEFSVVDSRDAEYWEGPRVFHRGKGCVSPACQVDGKTWHLWFIRTEPPGSNTGDPTSRLIYRRGPDLMHLGNEVVCKLEIPAYNSWHIDVQWVDSWYEALVAAFPVGTDMSRTRLFHATSKDGVNYTLNPPQPIIQPTTLGWDNRTIYRSTFLKNPDGTYRIWYSGGSWGRHFGIGLVQGPLESLTEDPSSPLAPIGHYFTRIPEELLGLLKYQIRHLLPSALLHTVMKVYGED